ncbi:hypothetical protein HPB49_011955 [Dermacentor silvarum]|uniref:Uncharacterized protein n=1 Tax=Dermacentor silvarum TaxID=543639 RepID=A0ACB8CL04_DERSI|nr:hypothetical protein HPB49_011955 [Dermacentor silvarum]
MGNCASAGVCAATARAVCCPAASRGDPDERRPFFLSSRCAQRSSAAGRYSIQLFKTTRAASKHVAEPQGRRERRKEEMTIQFGPRLKSSERETGSRASTRLLSLFARSNADSGSRARGGAPTGLPGSGRRLPQAQAQDQAQEARQLAIVGKAFSPKLIPVPLPLFHHKYHKVPVPHPVPVHFHHDTHYVQEAWPAHDGGWW